MNNCQKHHNKRLKLKNGALLWLRFPSCSSLKQQQKTNLTSVTKISIPSPVVYNYWAWYTYFCNRRYLKLSNTDFFHFNIIKDAVKFPVDLQLWQ